MTPLQIDLLLALRAVGKYGLDLEGLAARLRQGAHRDLTLPQLERAARDLADQSFAEPYTSPLKAKRWRITALGESALTEAAL